MLNLFKIEWLKIRTYRTFWFLYLSFMIFTPLAIFIFAYKFMTATYSSFEEQTLKSMLGAPFIFPKIWLTSSWFAGLFFIVFGMLFILLITNEVQYRTHRQNIIDGWSRMDFLKAKLTLLIFFVLSATLVVLLCGLLIGIIYTPSGYIITEGLYYVGYFVLMATLYLVVAFLVAILVKRTGLSIIIYFVLVVILDNILGAALSFNGFQAGYFMPMEVVDSLLPNPFKPGVLERRTVSDLSLMIGSFIYISAWVYIIVSYFKKVDLKT